MGRKILILGDLHIGARNGSRHFLAMMDRFFKNELFPAIKAYDVQNVFQLGDILDKRKTIDFSISDYITREFFGWFEKNKVHLFSLTGNHDMYFRNSLEIDGPSQFSESFKKVHIVKEPSLVNVKGEEIEGVCLVPWVCDENKDQVYSFLEAESSENNILLGHFEFPGFPMLKGIMSEGDSSLLDNLGIWRTIYSGHFHCPSRKGNIVYVGTPYELTWADYDDKKRFFILDIDTGEEIEIPVKEKMYRKIQYSDSTEIKASEISEGYIAVEVAEGSDPKRLEKFMSAISSASPVSVTVTRKKTADVVENVIEGDSTDPLAIMLGMIEKSEVEGSVKEEMRQIAIDVFREASEEQD